MKKIAFALLLLPSFTMASPNAPTPSEFQELMGLDYDAFDQKLPDGGWRAIVDNVDAGKTLDAYNVQNGDRLKPWQMTIIRWHAGQTYAMADLDKLAIARLEKSLNPDEKPDDKFKWNAYVRGSIAFLKKDRAVLEAARDEMLTVPATERSLNFEILESFLRCFNKTYKEAYNRNCGR